MGSVKSTAWNKGCEETVFFLTGKDKRRNMKLHKHKDNDTTLEIKNKLKKVKNQ